jgi:hypothetical protein
MGRILMAGEENPLYKWLRERREWARYDRMKEQRKVMKGIEDRAVWSLQRRGANVERIRTLLTELRVKSAKIEDSGYPLRAQEESKINRLAREAGVEGG